MSAIAISGVGKAFRQYASRRDRLLEWLSPFGPKRHTLRWVLEDIAFHVQPGEVVGIVGVNGAGKSTLLKLLAGTSLPSTGRIELSGRVAALLELGLGFHPDFTGRQNVHLTGQLLGYSESELNQVMPEIEAFAEIGNYFDQPLRIYSSGMQVRLAFSIATAIRPDILIVDEALSVGDVYFQHKSFERIRNFKNQGTTILLVSHDKNAILSICDRALLLNRGKIVVDDQPSVVMDYYNALLSEKQGVRIDLLKTPDGRTQTVSGSGEVRLHDIRLLNDSNEPVDTIDVGQFVKLRISLYVHQPVDQLVLGYLIKDRLGQPAFGTNTHYLDRTLVGLAEGEVVTYEFAFQAALGPGHYSVSTAPVSTSDHLTNNYEWRDLALMFSVVNMSRPHFEGLCWLPPELEVSRSCT